MTDRVDCVVIGAGVVGLAIARALALRGRESIVLEACDTIGTGTSSRNSEVIHAGIYYVPGSLKARFCVAGRRLLYTYCEARGVHVERLGKLIVATSPDQLPALAGIEARALACGVTDLQRMTWSEARALEPELACVAGICSPSTGIIDSHGFMLALQGDLERAGGSVALLSPLQRGRCGRDGIELEVGIDAATHLVAGIVINSAGLDAQTVAHSLEGLPKHTIPRRFLAKGSYYSLDVRAPFRRLIYPVPEAAGLGVHLTLDLGGRARFGPDVEWVEGIDYDVDPARADLFYAAIRRYWPGLPDESLHPGYAGIRPKLQGPDGAAQDFMIQGPQEHGVPGLVNLYGIESPGLTAALAIGEHVADLV